MCDEGQLGKWSWVGLIPESSFHLALGGQMTGTTVDTMP